MENDPTKAVAAARDFQPDLAILDVIMPDMDGGEVAEKFRADARLRDVPIVFLTAIVSKDFIGNHGPNVAGHTFLAKPVDAAELVQCVDQMLRKAA